jgi:putative redox protein
MSTTAAPTIDCATETLSQYPQELRIREHHLRADVGAALGSTDSAPGPHDYFDAALAACKALTATWYAKKNGIPLERVESHVERDDSKEREGTYVLRVRLAFHGPLTDEQRATLHGVVARCPIHKLMTTTDVQIETAPLAP